MRRIRGAGDMVGDGKTDDRKTACGMGESQDALKEKIR